MKIGQPELSEEKSEAPRPQGGASRRGSFVHIVPLDPAYKTGLTGHVPVKIQMPNQIPSPNFKSFEF